MQEYAHQLGHCLMDLQQGSSGPALHQLQTWVVELSYLVVAVKLNNPDCRKAFYQTKIDERSNGSAGAAQQLYADILVSNNSSGAAGLKSMLFTADVASCETACCLFSTEDLKCLDLDQSSMRTHRGIEPVV